MVSEGHLIGATLALVLAYGVGVVYFASLCAWLGVRARRASKSALLADASASAAKLSEGPTIICGEVEYMSGEDAAIRVEIHQTGTESEGSGGWQHLWREIDRRMHVQPFIVRLASGESVTVEPDQAVILADALDGITSLHGTSRVRVAQLSPGEEVVVTGVLQKRANPGGGAGRGYRDVASSFAMVPAPGERMIVSTRALSVRFREVARVMRGRAFLLAVGACVVHLVWLPFHARMIGGQVTGVTVVRTYSAVHEDSDGDDVTGYYADVLPDAAPQVTFETRYSALRVQAGTRAQILWVPWWPWASTLGPDATPHESQLVFLFVAFLALTFLGLRGPPRRWYEGQAVKNSGSGRLDQGRRTGVDDEDGRKPR